VINVTVRNEHQSNPRRALSVTVHDSAAVAGETSPISRNMLKEGDVASFNLNGNVHLVVSQEGIGEAEAAEMHGDANHSASVAAQCSSASTSTGLPSRFQLGAEVIWRSSERDPPLRGRINGVLFTEGKVHYRVVYDLRQPAVLVDSAFVEPLPTETAALTRA